MTSPMPQCSFHSYFTPFCSLRLCRQHSSVDIVAVQTPRTVVPVLAFVLLFTHLWVFTMLFCAPGMFPPSHLTLSPSHCFLAWPNRYPLNLVSVCHYPENPFTDLRTLSEDLLVYTLPILFLKKKNSL